MRQAVYAFCFMLSALLVADAYAQRRTGGGSGGSGRSSGGSSGGSSRGSSYNPSRGSSSGSSGRSSGSSSGSSSRGSSYNPSRGSSSSGSSSSGSSSRGSSYNPSRGSSSSGSSSSGSSSRGSSYNPSRGSSSGSSSSGSSSSGSTVSSGSTSSPRGPSYNPTRGSDNTPTVTRGPSYNPSRVDTRNPLPVRSVYAGRFYNHRPHQVSIPNLVVRYSRPYDYFSVVPRHHIYRWWVYEPVSFWYTNGYWVINDYPYYVYRGYRYRYSPVELCNYELVDSTNNAVVKVFADKYCSQAYDECALERDTANTAEQYERFFCAERVSEELQNTDDATFSSRPVDVDTARAAAIQAYLSANTFKDVYKDATYGNLGACGVVNYGLFGNSNGCRFAVSIDGKMYPDVEGSVCSDDDTAEAIGCNVGNEKENLGCILTKAIQDGYCSIP
jgi:hypothetical protein